jgi:HTH-type transcriptional regulator/antitoxin HigA
MEIHPIRNNEDHAAALREIERLSRARRPGPKRATSSTLAMLFEKYEDSRRLNIDTSDPIDLLNYAIEAFRDSQAE